MALISLDGESARVLAAIRQAGGTPLLVGGCVRDALTGNPAPKDIDVEVYGLHAGTDLLARALGTVWRVDEVGRSFGVVRVRAGSTDLDISLPRRERKTGPGHRGFAAEPAPDLTYAEASARRDFTINSLMYEPVTGNVIDHHGGLRDLKAGVLRHTSSAFAEDPLRVLRAVQFAARFGFTLDPATAVLCRSLVNAYAELPAERIWGEWEKVGTRGTDMPALGATGWEWHFPQLASLHGIPQDRAWHPEGTVWTHSGLAATQAARLACDAGLTGTGRLVVVMAALCHDFGKVTHTQIGDWGKVTSHGHAAAGTGPAGDFLESIGCPEATIARILPLIREHMSCAGKPTAPAVRRLARRLVPATMTELAIVVGADRAGRGDPSAPNPAEAWLEKASGLNVQEKPAKGLLTGDHLIAAGMTPGPAFRPILAAAVEAQDAGEFSDETGALAWLAERRAA